MITKKRGVLLFVAFLFFSLVWFLLNFSLLTVHYSSEGQTVVSFLDPEKNVKENELGLKSGESKTMLLNRNTYKIEVGGGDKLTVYKKPLGFFRDNLEVELRPQQTSEPIGQSTNFDCIAHSDPRKNFYYPCEAFGGVAELGSKTIIDPVIETASEHEHGLQAQEDKTSTMGTLKPYLDGLLSFVSSGNSLFITKIDPPKGFKKQPSLRIDNFSGQVSDHYVSTVNDGGTKIFTVYDNSSKQLLVFSGVNDSSPSRIDLSKELGDIDESALVQVFAARDQVKVVVRDVGELEDHSTLLGQSDNKEESLFGEVDQQVVSVDINKAEVDSVRGLPKGFYIRDIAASPAGDIIILPLYTDEDPIYLPRGDGSKDADFFQEGAKDVCWKDDDSFYYIAGSGGQIFLHLLSKQASYLVYGGLIHRHIGNIQCGDGKLYFSIRSEDRGDENNFFRLGPEEFLGIRPESILPIVIPYGSEKDVINIDLGRQNTVIIKPLLNSNLTASKKAEIKKLAIQELMNDGVAIKKLKFHFSF